VPVTEFWRFLLILARVSALFVTAPVLGTRLIPAAARIGLAALISIAVLPVAPVSSKPPDSLFLLAAMVAKEATIGLLIGYAAALLFEGIRTAGRFVDFQMGFVMMNVLDPTTEAQSSVIGQFQYMLALMLFLAVNGHHWLISAVVQSFRVISSSDAVFGPALYANFNELAFGFFVVILKIGAPVAAVLFLIDVGFAVLARAVPQMNVFVVGFPAKILMGFLTLAVGLSAFAYVVTALIGQLQTDLVGLVHSLKAP
jgi:flagellar biosynthetic protein FliR